MPSAPKKVFFHIEMYDNTNISFFKQHFPNKQHGVFPVAAGISLSIRYAISLLIFDVLYARIPLFNPISLLPAILYLFHEKKNEER
jgi:hypothetical protein